MKFTTKVVGISIPRRRFFHLTLMTVILVLTLVTDLLLNPTFSIAQKPNMVNLTVSAGAGLKAVLEDIRKVYQQQQSNINVTYNFAASGVLQRQIEQGANIDVLIAAASKNMDDLQREGLLLPKTRKNLIKSRVALIRLGESYWCL